MEQGEASAKIEPAETVEDHPAEQKPLAEQKPPRMLRVRLWWAISGLAVAIAIASTIATYELAKSLASRTNYWNRRMAALNASVRTLKRQTTVVQRKLGSERERATVGETFEKILFAPDLRTIKLTGPDKANASTEVNRDATGILAMSESADVAMLEASGLKPSGDLQVYRIWWVPKRGAAIWAADFLVGEDGNATVPVDLPPPRQRTPTIEITLENEAYAEDPSGPVALKGHLTVAK